MIGVTSHCDQQPWRYGNQAEITSYTHLDATKLLVEADLNQL